MVSASDFPTIKKSLRRMLQHLSNQSTTSLRIIKISKPIGLMPFYKNGFKNYHVQNLLGYLGNTLYMRERTTLHLFRTNNTHNRKKYTTAFRPQP